MPKLSRWQAQHKGCQAAVDNVKADLTAEIERLQKRNDSLWGTLKNAYDDLKTCDLNDLRTARRLILVDLKRAIEAE